MVDCYDRGAGLVEDARASGGEVDPVDDAFASRMGVSVGRNEGGEAEELGEHVNGVAAVGEAARGAAGEVDAVGGVVGPHG